MPALVSLCVDTHQEYYDNLLYIPFLSKDSEETQDIIESFHANHKDLFLCMGSADQCNVKLYYFYEKKQVNVATIIAGVQDEKDTIIFECKFALKSLTRKFAKTYQCPSLRDLIHFAWNKESTCVDEIVIHLLL